MLHHFAAMYPQRVRRKIIEMQPRVGVWVRQLVSNVDDDDDQRSQHGENCWVRSKIGY
jgi:hypothetical protein